MRRGETKKMEKLFDDNSVVMHHLGSSVAMHVIKETALPFTNREFPLLSNMCLKTLAQNFEKYPTLKGVSEYDKEYVN